MDTGAVSKFIDIFLHLDKYLNYVIDSFGLWSYAIFFVVIFAETGFVVTPFLPGDSLLFVIGTFAAAGSLKIVWVFVVLAAAAVLGDSVNYAIGKYFGKVILKHEGRFFIKKEHIERTYRFYEKYGAKTIVLARFVPIVRTFAPFVAGIGNMNYSKFIAYNVIGGLAWVALCVFSGYWFGNIPIVKKNFELVIIGIIFVSILPIILHVWQNRGKKQ
jgi:membrane-associated protein